MEGKEGSEKKAREREEFERTRQKARERGS
jgi:hypothetical protein